MTTTTYLPTIYTVEMPFNNDLLPKCKAELTIHVTAKEVEITAILVEIATIEERGTAIKTLVRHAGDFATSIGYTLDAAFVDHLVSLMLVDERTAYDAAEPINF